MRYKLRQIVKFKGGERKTTEIYGITIPPDVASFFTNAFFSVTRSGTIILLTSGTNPIPTAKQLKEFEFEENII